MLLAEKGPQESSAQALSITSSHEVPLVVRGEKPILQLQPLLIGLCARSGQPGNCQHLNYFFSLPFARNKTPYLLLFVSRPGLTPQTVAASDLVAAVLTYQYRLGRIPTRIFATTDIIGRRTVIAPPALRGQIALLATRFLIDHGAEVCLISYQEDAVSVEAQPVRPCSPQNLDCIWTSQQRDFFAYLSLKPDFEATMGSLGKRTRSHMRYYRRRAERELQCTFVPNVTISKADFQKFNRSCTFPVTDEVSSIRYNACFNSPNSFISGLRNQNGEWLSIAGGQKNHDFIEIYWQMNLDSVPAYSISTVMRSFLIEHEISCGTQRLYIEGGTPHPMRFYFVREIVSDILVRRKSLYGTLVARSAKYLLHQHKKHFLSQLLVNKTLKWQSW
jgi:hypothetical protein